MTAPAGTLTLPFAPGVLCFATKEGAERTRLLPDLAVVINGEEVAHPHGIAEAV